MQREFYAAGRYAFSTSFSVHQRYPLPLPYCFVAVAQERRHYVFDDAAAARFYINGYRHARRGLHVLAVHADRAAVHRDADGKDEAALLSSTELLDTSTTSSSASTGTMVISVSPGATTWPIVYTEICRTIPRAGAKRRFRLSRCVAFRYSSSTAAIHF